ncbi:MAG: TRAP transporter small permease [Deltaproteobacteria bacterium]|nr:TRAP transporter small permease [Deltaproteobacteria bacterium]MBW2306875.1 TRAP transporter small permease [Deltaproteobacteria bacterium]
MNRWERTDEVIDRVEHALIVILLSLMILVAFLQILLRNFFATGLGWGDPLVRSLVLWVGFIGAAIAAKEGKHINIDVVSRWLPTRGKIFIEAITQLFSFFVCGLLAFAALKFIKNEAQMGTITFLGIPGWVPQIILPITFGLMALRFCLRSFRSLSACMKMDTNPVEKGTG